jgi:hypothetical protein
MAKTTRKRPRAKGTGGRRARRERPESEFYKHSSTNAEMPGVGGVAPNEHYRREKARRVNRERPPDHPLEQARRAYHALLESDAARAKGGRPRKTATKKPPPGAQTDARQDGE